MTVHAIKAAPLAANMAPKPSDSDYLRRPVLTNVLITNKVVVSSDGKNLLIVPTDNPSLPESGIMIPATDAAELFKHKIKNFDEVLIETTDNGHIVLKSVAGYEKTIQTPPGYYPNYQGVMPKGVVGARVNIAIDETIVLLTAMKKVGARTASLSLRSADGPMQLDANNGVFALMMPASSGGSKGGPFVTLPKV